MLESLHISNVVLIETLHLDFARGLCALTGETGAGKSILLDSLGLAMGARSEARLVRKNADKASVTATFELGDISPFKALADENGIEVSSPLMLRRQINPDGRSRAWVNDQPVSITLLKSFGDMLVEYHGQFETHGLLDPKTHRLFLDEYADLEADLEKLAQYWEGLAVARSELAHAQKESEEARKEEEYIRHAVGELSELAPEVGEEDALLEQRVRLKNRDTILTNLAQSLAHITEEDKAESHIIQATRMLERIEDALGQKGADIIAQLDGAIENLREASAQIEDIAREFDEGGTSLEALEDRLYALRELARKHQCQVDDLPVKLAEMEKTLDLVVRQDDILSELEAKVTKAESDYEALADAISEKRKMAASQLDALVMEELGPLKLERAQFQTAITSRDENAWSATGKDDVAFLVATNPGAEPGPLHKIASGGEMARFMLALKVVLAEIGTAHTLVFDEVDTGIGGATASAVGQRLARLAQFKQILVVTHSPQVAAAASAHWIVSKSGGEAMRTTVIPLDERSQRREEIARMLAGAEITEEARAAAGKLLESDKAA